jgi:hypothetical protein
VLMRLGRIAGDLEAGICTPGPEGRVKDRPSSSRRPPTSST